MMKKGKVLIAMLTIVSMLFAACGTKPTDGTPTEVPEVTEAPTGTPEPTQAPEPTKEPEPTPEPTPAPKTVEDLLAEMTLADTMKEIGTDTPLMTQRFGADPCALVYDGRVYIYMTADEIEYSGGKAKDNSYSKIDSLNVISSADLVNWTDHGSVYAAGGNGAAKWGGNSWAPAAACKEIDGEMKFFLYFANGGNGIGVLTADSPVGPFKDPLGKALINRSTPNCANVDWLFDPAVLVDEDGSAYIYFGGGVPAGKAANPGTGRVAKLGDDMISLATEPVAIDIPYLFEDSGINKVGDTYIYSYCTNWNVDAQATKEYGFTNANIAYMTSDDPMGPFTYQGVVLKHPGSYFAGDYNNNHHAIFEFNGEWYITYHTRILADDMGVAGLNYRSTHITKINVNEDGLFDTVQKADTHSLEQQMYLNPYEKVEAETMATMGGLNTTQEGMISKTYGSGNMVLTDIQSGDWLALYGVDFGETGAAAFTAAVKAEKEAVGAIQIRLDSLDGEVVGCLEIGKDADGKNYRELSAALSKTVTGVHDLIFVFVGENYTVDYWQFGEGTSAGNVDSNPTEAPVAVPTEFTYNFNDLIYNSSYGTIYEVGEDGSVALQFDGQYQEIKFSVPKEIDMSYCYQVTVKAQSSYGPLSFKLYDSEWNQIFVEYNLKGDAVTEYKLAPSIPDTATGIGLMALDEMPDYSQYKATVYSVTFHMDEEYATLGQETPAVEETYSPIVTDGTNQELEAKWKAEFDGLTLADTLKKIGYDAPVMTQRFGADPYAIVYEGRVYLYMTGDVIEYGVNDKVLENSFSKINTLNVLSSDDLVNWTDHGSIFAAGRKGAATWGGNSWAPAVAYKEIDGKMKFFVYFANGGNGIGVLTSDSPTGPFTDPLGKALISRSTPNCSNVTWLFDPAVLVDDDGSAYIYFGGGIPGGQNAHPGTGRVAKLGDDMISLDGDPVALDTPYLFEDSGINKIGDTYYYSYCTNWNVDAAGTSEYGFKSAQIVYMTSDNPMGPFTVAGVILKNPGDYFGCYGTNHHCLFEFNDELYITYHTQVLERPMGISGGYRCTHIAKLTVNEDGTIDTVQRTNRESLEQVKCLNPYEKVEAETMATMGGLNTTQADAISKECGIGNMELCEIQSGDWLALYGVDFGETGATKFTAAVRAEEGVTGAMQIRLDDLDGEVIGYLDVSAGADGLYHEVTVDLLKQVTGEHNLIFVFCGEGYTVDYWQFQ